MAWENANLIFPQDNIQIGNQIIPVNALPKSSIKTITDIEYSIARQMLIKQRTFIWGKDGEFAIATDYDVMNCLPRPEADVPALNCYAMRMLKDYYLLNNIQI